MGSSRIRTRFISIFTYMIRTAMAGPAGTFRSFIISMVHVTLSALPPSNHRGAADVGNQEDAEESFSHPSSGNAVHYARGRRTLHVLDVNAINLRRNPDFAPATMISPNRLDRASAGNDAKATKVTKNEVLR